MKKASVVLLLLALIVGCKGPATPTPAAPTVPSTPSEIKIRPTPTPLPPPPTPTPIPTEKAEEAEMILIPAGPFIMGSDTGREDEAPAHEVDLPAFEIDRFEVTNAQFAAFVDATGYVTNAEKAGETKTWKSYYTPGKENHPVVKVSWNDAVAYCERVGKRLPTEAEWEKAARGTDGRVYPWGNEYDSKRVNGKDSGIRGTTAVGSYADGASPYGVFDMAGNVWEWVTDWYQPYPDSTYHSDYFGEKYKVLRGGGWFETAEYLRTTMRNASTVTTANDDLGFRCAR